MEFREQKHAQEDTLEVVQTLIGTPAKAARWPVFEEEDQCYFCQL